MDVYPRGSPCGCVWCSDHLLPDGSSARGEMASPAGARMDRFSPRRGEASASTSRTPDRDAGPPAEERPLLGASLCNCESLDVCLSPLAPNNNSQRFGALSLALYNLLGTTICTCHGYDSTGGTILRSYRKTQDSYDRSLSLGRILFCIERSSRVALSIGVDFALSYRCCGVLLGSFILGDSKYHSRRICCSRFRGFYQHDHQCWMLSWTFHHWLSADQ